jgi:hypothetical protein
MRGVQMTKQLVTSLKMMPMVESVAIPFFAKFIDAERGVFDPGERRSNRCALRNLPVSSVPFVPSGPPRRRRTTVAP